MLSVDAADPSGLESDVFHGSAQPVHVDRVAFVERLVEHDGERGKEVAEDVLHGERNGDTADAQPRYERGDVHAQCVREREQHEHRPHHEAQERPERPERGAAHVLPVFPRFPPAYQVGDDRRAPGAELKEHRQVRDDANRAGHRGRDLQCANARRERQRKDEVRPHAAQQVHHQVVHFGRGTLGDHLQPPHDHLADDIEHDHDEREDDAARDPGPQRIIQEPGVHALSASGPDEYHSTRLPAGRRTAEERTWHREP